MTLWSGRFSGDPDRDVFEFGKSLAVDRRLLDDDILGSQAWAQALGQAGVLSAADVTAIVDGLAALDVAVVLVRRLVTPAPEAAPAVDAVRA